MFTGACPHVGLEPPLLTREITKQTDKGTNFLPQVIQTSI